MKKLIEIIVCMLLIGTFFVVTLDTVSAAQDGDYTYFVSNGEATLSKYNGAGRAITIPSTLGGYSTMTIGEAAFRYNTNLFSVIIPDSVTTIGRFAFASCPSLTSVTIPGSVDTIPYNMFLYDHSLTSVTIGNGVSTIGEKAFEQCLSLTSVTIPSSVTTIEGGAFVYCTTLTSITFLGLVAPATVGNIWIDNTPTEIRGHAYPASNFPASGGDFHGLMMGTTLSGGGGSENKPPVAGFTWTPLSPTPNQEVSFDALTSHDPDGSLTSYEWDWNNDGTYEESHTTPTATHSWTQAGNYPVTVRVTDNNGATSIKTITIPVGTNGNTGGNTGGNTSGNTGGNTSGNTNGNNTGGNNAGKKTPGFELVFVIGAIAIALFLWKKKRNL